MHLANEDLFCILFQYLKTPPSAYYSTPKISVTANIILRGPGYLIMPGSKIFHKANSTGRTLLHKWSGYKPVIEEYGMNVKNFVCFQFVLSGLVRISRY